MKFSKLTALTPEGEHFDSTAVNEGIWLSEAHLNAIESALEGSDVATLYLKNVNKDLSEQVQALQSQLQMTVEAKEALVQENAAFVAQINDLEVQIEELGQQPSGNGSSTTAKQDPAQEPAEVPSYLDDASPINEWIDRRMKKSA